MEKLKETVSALCLMLSLCIFIFTLIYNVFNSELTPMQIFLDFWYLHVTAIVLWFVSWRIDDVDF